MHNVPVSRLPEVVTSVQRKLIRTWRPDAYFVILEKLLLEEEH